MLLKILYGVIRNTVSSGQNHELLKTSYRDFKAKICNASTTWPVGGGGGGYLGPVTRRRGWGIKKVA